MTFSSLVNKLSKTYNKFVMIIFAIIIFGTLVGGSFNASSFTFASSSGIILLVTWILFTLISFFYTLNGIILNRSFHKAVKEYTKVGKPIKGIRGFDELVSALNLTRNSSILITIASGSSLSLFVASVLADFGDNNLSSLIITLAATFAFITLSVIFLVEYPEETSFSPGGLIGFYEPDVFPLTLDNILSDVFTTYLDPATFMEIDEWTSDILSKLLDSFENDEDSTTRVERAREKILLLTYLNVSNPDLVPFEIV